jgi:hypothetical protein
VNTFAEFVESIRDLVHQKIRSSFHMNALRHVTEKYVVRGRFYHVHTILNNCMNVEKSIESNCLLFESVV